MVSKRFLHVLQVLLVMIVGLMALGAGVRTMNAGLSCPDWPLCFGQVIPDFHVGVYFEFIHRAYAGLVALVFFGCLVYLLRHKEISKSVKRLGLFALVILAAQIVMGGLTVLKLLQFEIVTSHLALATLFFAANLWIYFSVSPQVAAAAQRPSLVLRWSVALLPVLVFGQLILGGLVASSYAGVVCVDFPTCNGQWIPTLSGPIGLQVVHRLGAYTVALAIFAVFAMMRAKSMRPSLTAQTRQLSTALLIFILLQITIGVSNLFLYIPAWLSVLHLTVGIVILAFSLRLYFVTRALALASARAATAGMVDSSSYAFKGISG